MAIAKGQLTGMRGVYLVAAELTRCGYIVSPTSRSAAGADLLVTDADCRRAYTVQVKTNGKPASFWLAGKPSAVTVSRTHIFVLVNIGRDERHEFYVVPSAVIRKKTKTKIHKRGTWHEFHRADANSYKDGWHVFEELT